MLSPQVPESVFEEILPKVLKDDLRVILSSPKYLELFLLAKQRVPAKLESLVGSVDLFSEENIPRFEERVGGLSLGGVLNPRLLDSVAEPHLHSVV